MRPKFIKVVAVISQRVGITKTNFLMLQTREKPSSITTPFIIIIIQRGENGEPSELGLGEDGALVLGLPLLEKHGDVEDKEADELSQEHGEGLVHRLLKINALLRLRIRGGALLTLIISLVGAQERLLVLHKKRKG